MGYFDLIDQVDCFVLLDHVQFEKQSWQQRNRIKGPTGLQWLTVPVVFRGLLGQPINDVKIREPKFWQTHLRAIELSYRRTPHFERYFLELSKILEENSHSLVELNIRAIDWFCHLLGVSTRRVRSSEIGESGKRSELLVNLCRHLAADSYLSPIGSSAYVLEDNRCFSDAGIQVAFQHYEHPAYKQLFPPFCPFASALDLIFNEGNRSMEIIRSGRRASLTPDDLIAAKVESKA
jgi:WbqC-like protein family